MLAAVLAGACIAAASSGCTPGSDRRTSSGGQVVARVDDRELTVHQVNQLLSSSRTVTDDPATRRLALEALIDQQLLAERALREALDRDPAVLAQIQGATRRVLAAASIERIAAAVGTPTREEVRAFHEAHPALFARRRTYVVDEISVARGAPPIDAVRARVAAARRLDDVAEWLRERGALGARREGVIRPEDAGPVAAAALQPLGEGALTVLDAAGGMQIVQIRRIEAAPLTLAAATPWIERHLLEQRRRAAIDREVAALRRESRIALLGEFAQPESRGAPASEPTDRAHVDRGVGALR